MVEDSEQYQLLRQHILESHVGQRTIEKISRHDLDMADVLYQERRQRFQIDDTVRKIVVNYIRRGIRPEDIPWLIDYDIRCLAAGKRGQGKPTGPPRNSRIGQ
ncbi:hypothetical protein ACFLUU_06185 [Chloroflexota bacterium]